MNIGEIARRAGVSRSTVSYALSGKRPVSAETRRKIQRVIDELGYRPNASARALADGRTRTLGLVFPPAGQHYLGMQLEFIGSVVEAAASQGYDVLLSPSGEDSEQSFQRLLGERRVDGAILMEIRLADDRVDHLVELDFPFVSIGRIGAPDHTWWVAVDHGALVAACVDHLADLGHRRYRPDQPARAAAAHRLRVGPPRPGRASPRPRKPRSDRPATTPATTTPRPARRVVERILRDDPGTTALVTLNEAALGGLYRGLAEAGRTVPQDFSIAGVVLTHWAETVTPQLTAADVPAEQLGRLAVDLLVARIADPERRPATTCWRHRSRCGPAPVPLRCSTNHELYPCTNEGTPP